ncbi:MAG: ParB/RepB/Spo0J family partition protein [Candidatus Acidiferrales bacterium]
MAQSIRSHGLLSPLVVRRLDGHLEIVSGARRYRAAQRAGLAEIPVRLLDLGDGEAQELQIVENVQRADVHPFEEAQGFQALLDRAGGEYSIETIAARTGKSAAHVCFSPRSGKILVPTPVVSTAHIAQRKQAMAGLVLISDTHNRASESEVLARPNYVEVIARKSKKGKQVRPDERLCDRLSPAIYADGIDKGRLVKVCADKSCPVHFREQQRQEKQRAEWRAERAAVKRKAKQTLSLRHRVLADVVKRVKAPFGCDELRFVARFVLRSLLHNLAGRLAKRHGLDNPEDPHDWHAAEKARQGT